MIAANAKVAKVDWKTVKLEEVGRIVTGKTPSTKIEEWWNGDVQFVTPGDIQQDKHIFSTARYITSEGLSAVKNSVLPKGAICVSCIGVLGYVGMTTVQCVSNQQINSIIPYDFVDRDYVYYAIKYIWPTFKLYEGTSSVVSILNKSTFSDFTIPLPPLPTQRKIAAVLGALDDKIENNRKICANLEAQAQALFKSWFVDFEPFGGKMVSDDVWGNHPEALKYIPVSSLNPILETGSRPKGGAVSSGVPSIGAENVKHLGVFDFNAAKFIPIEYAEKLKRGKINGFELLLYKDGGKPGMFKPHFSMFGDGFPFKDCYINEHVFKIDFGSPEANIFSYFYFKSHYVYNWLETNGSKVAIPGINQSNVLDVMMPDIENVYVKKFGSDILPFFHRIFKTCKESRSLAELRDALLPKLMSGELDVSEVAV